MKINWDKVSKETILELAKETMNGYTGCSLAEKVIIEKIKKEGAVRTKKEIADEIVGLLYAVIYDENRKLVSKLVISNIDKVKIEKFVDEYLEAEE